MSDASDVPAPKPDHAGHRERLRHRFHQTGGEGFADYELLELLLMAAIPQKDVKPLAKDLLRRFDTFAGVISASAAELESVRGISLVTATSLKVVQAASLRLLKQNVGSGPILNSWDRLMDYLAADMAHREIEYFRLLLLDKKNCLLADEIQQSGTIDHTPVYPREVLKRAIEANATAVILVHNHPSGDPTPSRADIDMTKEIVRALAPVGITVHDHLIIGRKGTSSFKSLGLLQQS